MTQFHFISGLPRSGSTLLAAILRQNPAIHASMSSPVGGIFAAVQKAISGSNEAAMFLDEGQRARLLRSVFDSVYIDQEIDDKTVIFDTNRIWPAKLPTLVKLFPDAKIIACVRRPAWILNSIERLIRANPLELSGIFGFEPGGTVFSRVQGLMSPTGLVGFALDALREGYYSPLAAGRMRLVEYEALARSPRAVVDALYDWLEIPRFPHDFENIEQIPGALEFDRRLGTPGLHSVKPKVEWATRESVLPPGLLQSLPTAFWRAQPNPDIDVIHLDEAPLPTTDQIEAMRARVREMTGVTDGV